VDESPQQRSLRLTAQHVPELDKPLHVQVAEALGLDHDNDLHEWDEASEGRKQCTRCGGYGNWSGQKPFQCAKRYDFDWSATGPIIERHLIWLETIDDEGPIIWIATRSPHGNDEPSGYGQTPLLAVCSLLLQLAKAGKLDTSVTLPAQIVR